MKMVTRVLVYYTFFHVLISACQKRSGIVNLNEVEPMKWKVHSTRQAPEVMTSGTSESSPVLNFIKSISDEYVQACYTVQTAIWAYETNMTKETKAYSTKKEDEFREFQKRIQKEIMNKYPHWKTDFKAPKYRRAFSLLMAEGPGTMSDNRTREKDRLEAKMIEGFSTATVCDYEDKDNCNLRLNPDLGNKMITSNLEELEYYWTAWHDAVSKSITPMLYKKNVDYLNENAKANGFKDAIAWWLDLYDDGSETWSPETFQLQANNLWEEIRPFYSKLFAYVRMKLRRIPQYRQKIKKYGVIPAHLFGGMYAQEWDSLDSITKPFPEIPSLDATDSLIKQGYTPRKMVEKAALFFENLGLDPLPPSFWNNSIFEKPNDGREMICHFSAQDFCINHDLRVNQCTRITMKDFIGSHHEMGHIVYYQQYEPLPYAYREGGNPAFHEAIGDTIALSVMTPKYLQCGLKLDLGLKDYCKIVENSKPEKGKGSKLSPYLKKTDINYLYLVAIEKLPVIAYAISLEQWRWQVFQGHIEVVDYNNRFWKIREKQQGTTPPSVRPPGSLDAASKFHVPSNVPYIRYFFSHILQFQFYQTLCEAAGQYKPNDFKPLHQCDFSGSLAAGSVLKNILRRGSSQDWPKILQDTTGTSAMSTDPLITYFQPLFDHIDKELADNAEKSCYGSFCEDEAKHHLKSINEELLKYRHNFMIASFDLYTDLDNATKRSSAMKAKMDIAYFERNVWKMAKEYDFFMFEEEDVKRQLMIFSNPGVSALSSKQLAKLDNLISEMSKTYTSGKVCPFELQDCDPSGEGLPYSDIADIFHKAENYDELLYYWVAWRNVVGKPNRQMFSNYVKISNLASRAAEFPDMGESWVSQYEEKNFKKWMKALLDKLMPLYQELHAFVRFRLKKVFPHINESAPLPAHIFGNMWAEEWHNIYKHVVPFPDAEAIDVTPTLEKIFTNDLSGIRKMFDVANNFFVSLNLSDMSVAYDEKSQLISPKNKTVECNPYAWNMFDRKDFRISFCGEVNMYNFIAIHHQLGHIQYYMSYKDLPIAFQNEANPAFHEAIGDTIALSVSTIDYMRKIGLLNSTPALNDSKVDINSLMALALRKVCALPWAFLVDQYRWEIFEGKIAPENYTYAWWKLRNELQGVVPPVTRTENDFDPAAKPHVSSGKPYIEYFFSLLLQFQFHRDLAKAAGQYPHKPLYASDIHGSVQAGQILKDIMKSGKKENWKILLKRTTGEEGLVASAMEEYFQPLLDFMRTERQKQGYPIGWDSKAFIRYLEK